MKLSQPLPSPFLFFLKSLLSLPVCCHEIRAEHAAGGDIFTLNLVKDELLFYGHLHQSITGSDVGEVTEGVLENPSLGATSLLALLEVMIYLHQISNFHTKIKLLGRDPGPHPKAQQALLVFL